MLSNLLELERPLAILDVETTGGDPMKDRVMQFGMEIHYPNSPDVKTYKTLVDPDGYPVHPKAEETHGITAAVLAHGCAKCWRPAEEHPADECEKHWPIPKFKDIGARLHSGLIGCDFGGYNLKAFDLPLLEAEFGRLQLKFDWRAAYVLDVYRLWQVMEKRTLSDAHARFTGRTLEDAHDAMIDVIGTRDVFVGQLTAWPGLPRTLDKLHELLWPRNPDWVDSEGKFIFINGVACINFGKEKGRPMSSCRGYLQWMVGQSFSEEVKAIVRDGLIGKYPTR